MPATSTSLARKLSIGISGVSLVAISLACGFSGSEEHHAAPPPRQINWGIAESSRTPECRLELEAAIEALRVYREMPFTATPQDAQSLMSNGIVPFRYARAGDWYTAHIRILGSSDTCTAALTRLLVEPFYGDEEIRSLDPPPSVHLSVCRCAPE